MWVYLMEKPDVLLESPELLSDDSIVKAAEFFGLNDRVKRYENKEALSEVIEWAKKKTGSDEIIDILLHIRSVERTFRGGEPNEDRLNKIRRFALLDIDQEKLNKEKELLVG